MKNQKGFTLIEMLIVLAIISTLLILLIPNLADKNEKVQNKGCTALAQMVESQLLSYELDFGEKPSTLAPLLTNKYLKSDTCANGTKKVELNTDGTVGIVNVNEE